MRSRDLMCGLAATVLFVTPAFAQAKPPVHYGSAITEADVAALDIDIRGPDGKGLPPGKGTAADGAKIFAEKCVACHGEQAKGGSQFGSMVGGIGSFTTDKRMLTPGSMYPYAPILFDYTRRAMPMSAPQSLTNDEVYALTAYIYQLNGLLPADGSLDAASLSKLAMPNKDGFLVDNRPDTKATRCMKDCPPINN